MGASPAHELKAAPIVVEELVLDPVTSQAFLNGASTKLTSTEFAFLYELARGRGRELSRDDLLEGVWGDRGGRYDRSVDVVVRRLRDKIDRQASSRHRFVQTCHGVGYKLEPVPK